MEVPTETQHEDDDQAVASRTNLESEQISMASLAFWVGIFRRNMIQIFGLRKKITKTKNLQTYAIAALIPGMYLGLSCDLKIVPPLIPATPPNATNKALASARFHCPRTLFAW